MKSAILSNQRLINEIDSIRDNFIQSRPHMAMSVFKSTRKHGDRRTNKYDNIVDRPIFKDDRGAGSPSFQSHPLGYQPPGGNTLHPDPLFSGVVDRPTPKKEKKNNILKPFTPIAEAFDIIEERDDRPDYPTPFEPIRRYINKKVKGGAMLKRNMPLTGEDSSDDEGAGYLNGYSSSDDEDDYDDGAGFSDNVKDAYHKLSKKSQDAIEKLRPYGKEILKKLSTPEAMKIGSAGLTVLLLAVASSYVPATIGRAILPAITAKVLQLAQAVSEGAISMVTAKKELKKIVDNADSKEEITYSPRDAPHVHGDDGGKIVKRFGVIKGEAKPPKGGKINKIVGTKRGEKVRGAIVAEYVRKHKVSLGEASKKVKELGLY
jgi:hypothetical protein